MSYLNVYFPDHPAMRAGVSASVTERAKTLLDELRRLQAERANDTAALSSRIEQDRANTVKVAVARLVGGYQKLSVDDLHKQAIEMCADSEFWQELRSHSWMRERMIKLLGSYWSY